MNTTSRTTRRIPASNGFTIIETLVAITILMIAVAGPLVIATKGLNSALASKNQMIASYLAQESLEIIKNKRDANIAMHQDAVELHWLDGFDLSSICNGDSNSCDINASNDDLSTTCAAIGCQMYYAQETGYSHTGSQPTVFHRRFYFQDQGTANSISEKLVHVIVDWNEGTVPYQVHLTSQLVAVSR
jgi:Tfp pilus assembly protein PilV